jgi:hypothetical protein
MPEEPGTDISVGASADTGPVIPEGMSQIATPELEQLRAGAAQVSQYEARERGMRPWMDGARELGVNSPEEFADLKALLAAKPAGLNNAAFAQVIQAALSGGDMAGAAASVEQEPVDVKAMIDEAVGGVRRENAQGIHDSAITRQGELFKAGLGSFFAEDDDDETRFLYEAAANAALQGARNKLYDDGHPLREVDFQPMGEEDIQGIFKALGEKRAGFKAARLAAKGDAVNAPKKPKTATVAGGGTEQGGSGSSDESKPTRTRRGLMGANREAAEASLAARQAARQRPPMSSQSG